MRKDAVVAAVPKGCTSFKLRQLTRRVSQHYDRVVASSGLKTTQYSLLSQIEHLGPVRPSDLAAAMALEASTLTRNLQPLVANGWAEIGGRRRAFAPVTMTERGRASASRRSANGSAPRSPSTSARRGRRAARAARRPPRHLVRAGAGAHRCLKRLPPPPRRAPVAFGLVLLSAGGVFAVTMGARQSMGLFLASTRPPALAWPASASRSASASCGGLTQPLAGMVADRHGAGRVLLSGWHSRARHGPRAVDDDDLRPDRRDRRARRRRRLRRSVGAAVGDRAAGAAGKRGIASGIVNAGGSFGQFAVPIAQGITVIAGWAIAIQHGGDRPLALPAAWIPRGSSRNGSGGRAERGAGAPRRRAGDPARDATATSRSPRAFSLRLPRRLHRHPPAGRRRGVSAAPAVGAWRAIVGLFNIVGSLRWLGGHRWRMKCCLLIYAARGSPSSLPVRAEDRAVVLVFAAASA
jgi:hypothetical protein